MIGGFLLLLALLIPPWKTDYINSRAAGYGFLFAPAIRVQLSTDGIALDDSTRRVSLDIPILTVEIVIISVATLLGIALTRPKS